MSNEKENFIALTMVGLYGMSNKCDGVEEAKVVEELEDVGQNEPAEEPQDVGQDEPAEEPLHVGQQPIEWNKTVFRSMANLSKKQVL
ncbi:hypothetical protein L195_g034651, partial [Trifolium pratense]